MHGGLFRASAAAPSDLNQLDFFEKKIRPVLSESCYECHSASAKKVKGGLLVDTAEGLLKGGDTGPALVPGKPDKSLLLITMRHWDSDPDMAMPPKKDILSDEILANFYRWIDSALDPRDGKAVRMAAGDVKTCGGALGLLPIANPPVPTPQDGQKFIQNPVDAFVLAKLTEKKLTLRAGGQSATLLHRVT